MKKGIIILLSVFCVLLCSTTANAKEAEYKNANEIFQYWEEYGYPDYICGVWSSNESQTNLTFAIQDNESGNKGKQKIIDLVDDDSTLSFVYQEYSLNYLCESMDEIYSYFINTEHAYQLGFVSMGIDSYNNCLNISILESKKELEDTTEFINTITKKYGNAISISYTDTLPEGQEDVLKMKSSEQISKNSDTTKWVFIIVLLLAVSIFSKIYFRKRNQMS